MIFSREMMIGAQKLTKDLLDIAKENGDKYIETDGTKITDKFKNWCRIRGLKIKRWE